MNWTAWALIGAGAWVLAWVAAAFPWKWLVRLRAAQVESPCDKPGDYVPDEWVAEWLRQQRDGHDR